MSMVKEGVKYWEDIESNQEKESVYLKTRDKESRLLDDELVSSLPNLPDGQVNSEEWKSRKKSVQRLTALLKSDKPLRVLDVGCGNGWMTKEVIQAVPDAKVFGVDLNQKELEQAVRITNGLNAEFHYMDLLKNCPFEEEYFDIILFNASIQYFDNLDKLFEKCKVLLQLTGRIIINDSPIYGSAEDSKSASNRSKLYYARLGVDVMSDYYFHHTRSDLERNGFLENKGFTLSKCPFPLWIYTKNQIKHNPDKVSQGFGNQSVIFDELYDANQIVNYMRKLIREEVLSQLKAGDHILEINAGTGTDAMFFAQNGFQVTAVEISPGMVKKANEKCKSLGLQDRVKFINASFEELDKLSEKDFDFAYSNFGGLNCTPNLIKVVESLLGKLKSGGRATMTILPPFTLWEKLHALKGNFEIANRRKKQGPSLAHIEGEYFHCWYYNPKEIISAISSKIAASAITGLCIFVPPSFMDQFPKKHPFLYKWLIKVDSLVAKWPVFNRIGDYFMLSVTKK